MSTRVPREKTLFCEAVEITDPEQRRQFLDQACGSDKALRQQLERLLAISERAGDFFSDCQPGLEDASKAAVGQVASMVKSALDAVPDEISHVGPYKLLQKIVEGGCGVKAACCCNQNR